MELPTPGRIAAFTCGLTLGISTLSDPFTSYWDYSALNFLPYVLIMLLGCIMLVVFRSEAYFRANTIDSAVLSLYALLIFSALASDHVNIARCISLTACLCNYFTIRFFVNSKTDFVAFFLPIAGVLVIELAISIPPLLEHRQAWSRGIIGTLGNSGIFSCFVVSLCILCLFFAHEYCKPRKREWVVITFFLLGSIMSVVTLSRASIVSLAACFAVYIYFYYGSILRDRVFPIFQRKVHAVVFSAALCLICSAVLFSVKFNSAIGRLLIWKVSANNIEKSLLQGIGFGNFSNNYLNWQSEYFRKVGNENKLEVEVADLTYEAFNEPLQLFVENGLIGLSLSVWLVHLLFRSKANSVNTKQLNFFVKLSIANICLFSLFSYPFQSMPVLILLSSNAAIISALSNSMPIRENASKAMLFSVVAIFVASLWFVGDSMRLVSEWEHISRVESNGERYRRYRELYPKLKTNGLFLKEYGKFLFREKHYIEAITVLNAAKEIYIDDETFYFLAMSYDEVGMFRQSEVTLLFAADMLPHRFKPRFLLAKLYIKYGNLVQARVVANDILNMPEKVPSFEVDYMKFQMNGFIKSLDR